MRLARAASAFVATATIAALVAGCGDDSDDTPASSVAAGGSTPATSTTTTSGASTAKIDLADGDVCTFVDLKKVAEAAGATDSVAKIQAKPPIIDKPGESVCYWNLDKRTIFTLTRYTAPIDVNEKFAELKSGLFYKEGLPDPGVGDDSFYRMAGHNDAANVVFRTGDIVFYLSLGHTMDTQVTIPQEEEARPKAAEIAKQILARGE